MPWPATRARSASAARPGAAGASASQRGSPAAPGRDGPGLRPRHERPDSWPADLPGPPGRFHTRLGGGAGSFKRDVSASSMTTKEKPKTSMGIRSGSLVGHAEPPPDEMPDHPRTRSARAAGARSGPGPGPVGRDPSPDSAVMTRPFVPASSAHSALLCMLSASLHLAA